MRRVLIVLLGLVASLLAVTPLAQGETGPGTPPNFSGESLRATGNDVRGYRGPSVGLRTWDCQRDGSSTLTLSMQGDPSFGGGASGSYVGATTMMLTVTIGPQSQQGATWAGPITSLEGTFTASDKQMGPAPVPFFRIQGTLSLAPAGASAVSLGQVMTSGSCTATPPDGASDGLVSFDVSALTTYTVEYRNAAGKLFRAPGGHAKLTASYREQQTAAPYCNCFTTSHRGTIEAVFGATDDFVAAAPDVATQLELSPAIEREIGTYYSPSASATTAGGRPTDGVSILFDVAGARSFQTSCSTLFGHCSPAYSSPQAPGDETITACADNNANGTCDTGEPTATSSVNWFVLEGPPIPTEPGLDVDVPLIDQNRQSVVDLSFGSVTSAGVSSVTTTWSGQQPVGFTFAGGSPYYDIATTATFSGPVEVCIRANPYAFSSEADFLAARLYHYNVDHWENIWTHSSYAEGLICGLTNSFSPFAIGKPDKADDLAIASVADLVVAATGPTGALVTYAPPAVTGSGATVPAAVCAPASGALLPIGRTTVTCTADDPQRYNNGPQVTTFLVTVVGAPGQLQQLRTAVTNVGSGNSLRSKVEAVQAALGGANKSSTCTGLKAFSNEVSAQSGKKITVSQAAAFTAAARQIGQVVGC